MADQKISQLTAAASALTTDEYAVNQSGTSKKVTGAQIVTLVAARTVLTTNTTINVPSTYATLEAAFTRASQIDFGGFTLTIQLANGTYSPSVAANFIVPVTVGQAGASNLLIKGDATTPSNVVLSSTNSFSGTFVVGNGASCRVQGIKFTGGGNTFAIVANQGGYCEIVNNDFSTGHYYHRATESGGQIQSVGAYTISAGAGAHIGANNGGFSFDVGSTITLTGTPAWVGGYAAADALSFIRIAGGTSFVGSATGPRYSASRNGVIDVAGGGATYLPGNAAGSTATGGLYS